MEIILHILGICKDNHTHFDLLELLVGGTFAGGFITYIKYYWCGIKLIIKEFFNKIIHKKL
tara:strand:+ start:989 stop:1171 length:183 start_codon:yes stop_codon:yes gene_type:complete